MVVMALVACDQPQETETTNTTTQTSITETNTTETNGPETGTTHTGTTTTKQDHEFGFNLLHTFPSAGHLQAPVDMAALPNGQLLILTLGGYLYRFDTKTDTMLDHYFIADLVNGQNLNDNVAMVAHPEFGDGVNDYIYVYRNKRIDIARYQVSLDPLVVGKSEVVFDTEWEIGQSHSGGDLIWRQEGTDDPIMYVSIGLSGAPIDPVSRPDCNDEKTVACALLALKEDADGTLVAAITDTPYANKMVVAKGLRQPWRIADCGLGVCIVDVAGNEIIEEVNLYTQSGANFGYTGTHEKVPSSDTTYPLLQYLDTEHYFAESDPDNSGGLREMKAPWISGAIFTDNVFAEELTGKLVWGDIYDGWLRTFDPSEKPTPTTEHLAHLRYISTMIEASDGQVYAISMTGSLNRLVYRNEILRIGESGMALQDTSYFDDGIEYQVMHPFWSNGAEKSRKLQIPEGQLIDNTEADWQYPVGTRLWKTFESTNELGMSQAVEVRLLEYRETGWVAGTFIYEADGQAYLSDGYDTTVSTAEGEYAVPSEVACFECHAGTAGEIVPLSLEKFQLGDAGLDLLRPHLIEDPGMAPQVMEGDALEKSIRGALHANCSFCHNPSGRATSMVYVPLNFLFNAPLKDTNTIGIDLMYWYPIGGGNPVYIDPGSSDNSAIPKAISQLYMPPLGIWKADEALVSDIKDWIDAM